MALSPAPPKRMAAQALVDVDRAGVELGVVTVGVDALEAALLRQPLGDELEVGLHVLLGDLGELVVGRVQRRAAVPGKGLAGVRVDAEGNELLPVAEDLDLVRGAVGRLEGGRHFRERGRGAKRQGALGQAPEADENLAPVAEQLLGHVLGERGRLGVGDVDVDRRA